MAETRITREEIKGISRKRSCERADGASCNEGGSGDECDCNDKDHACEWHDKH
jgi:hypothetical protein